MSHVIPPPHLPRINPVVTMMRGTPQHTPPVALPIQAPKNPRVRVFPSADGTVTIVGVTIRGKWVAEYRCLSEDFDDRCILAMERRVRAKERRDHIGPHLVG